MKYFLFLLLIMPLLALGQTNDPRSVIPEVTQGDFAEGTDFFGNKNYHFSEKQIEILNFVNYRLDRIGLDLTYDTDMFLWDKSTMTGQEFVEAVEAKMKAMEARVVALETP